MSAHSRSISRLSRHLLGISALLAVLTAAGCSSSNAPAAPTAPNLSGAVTPQGAFTPNEVGAKYSIVVSNAAGALATTGAVTVTDPDTNFNVTGMTGMNGSLWVCTIATFSCTRSDSLAAGASYDPIIVTGTVTAGAGQSVQIGITIMGGGLTSSVSSPASISIVSPPTISKAFNPAAIILGANSVLTFTITNPAANTVAQTGVGFTDTLPAGLAVAAPNGLATTCGGTATAAAGSSSISLTGGTVGVNMNCTLTVNVTGTAVGVNITNTSGAVSSTNGGTGNTATASLTVNNPAPAITSLSPTTAVVGGPAFTLTVNGTGFVSTSVVAFNGSNRATTFVSATQLTASILTTDIAATGSFAVAVTNPAPGGGTSTPVNFPVNNPVPAITLLSPSSVTVGAAAQTLTINGTNFLSTSTVTYNSVAHVATFVNSTQLTIQLTAPDQATAGTDAVVVTNPAPGGGPSNSFNFTVNNPAPTLTSISPTSGLVGQAATLTLTGTNFIASSTVNLGANADNGGVVSNGGNTLTITIPAGQVATTGAVNVTVTNAAPGGGTTAAQTFTVNNPAPTLTSISPTSGLVSQAVSLTLTGTNFIASSTVNFGANADNGGVVSNGGNTLTITIPAGQVATTGAVNVTVTNAAPGGGTTAAQTFTVNNPVPAITSLSPSTAVVGGTAFTLTVNGTGFVSTSVVNFNSVAQTTTFVSATQVTASIPSTDIALTGSFPVTVSNPAPGGGTSLATNFSVTNPPPIITSLSPLSATEGGATFTLTVNGTAFISGATVNFNGVAETTTFVNATQVTASIPATAIATAGTFPVTVTNPAPGGGTSAPTNFTVDNPAPTITSLSPPSVGEGAAAQTLTITGTNFVSTSTVTYNAVAHAATFVSSTQLTIQLTVADQATAGTDAVVVTNPAPGGGSSTPLNLTVNNPAPTTTSLSPSSASAGVAAQTLTINGTNFVSTSTVTYNGVAHAATFVNDTQLTIQLSTGDQATGGMFAVVVTNPAPGGGTSAAVNFTVNNPLPTITSLSPSSAGQGSAAQALTINGTNFVSISTVTYNAVAHAATFVSSTQLTITLTTGDQATAGTFPVVVTNPAPGGGMSNSVNFTVTNFATSITSLVLHPNAVTGGGTSIGTAIFNGSAPSGATLTLSSGNTSAATVPATVAIPTGATSVNFTITDLPVNSPASSTITASTSFSGVQQQQSTLSVNPSGNVFISSVTLAPSTVDASPTVTGSFTGTVSLSSTVTANTTVMLSSSNNSAATVPPTVTVLAGQGSAGFTGTVPTGTSFFTSTITATLNGENETAILTVNPAGTPIVQTLALTPTAVVGGAASPNGTSTGTVTLNAAPASNVVVILSSDNAVATVPSSVIVLATQTTATFPITTSAVTLAQTADITASVNGSETAVLQVNLPVVISSTNPLPLGATGITYLGTGTATAPGFVLARKGGVGSFTWSPVTPLPAGLSLSSSGVITGTPTNVSGTPAGTSFEVQLTDHEASPVTVNTTLAITVVNPASACDNVVGGTINDALLSARYQIQFNGVQGGTNTPAAEAGSVFFNGSGGIGSSGAQLGEVDINLASGPQHLTITGGSYAVNTSGQGCFQVTYSGGTLTGQVFHFVMNPVLNASNIATNGTIMEFDAYQGSNGGPATILGSGLIRIANTTEFSNSSISAHVAFGGHGRDYMGLPLANAGSFIQNGNNTSATVTNFEEDIDDAGTISTLSQSEFSSITLASTATTATTGREILTSTTIPAAGSVASLTAAYIVNSNEAYLADISTLNSNNGITGGTAVRTFSTFAASDFSGTYEFRQTGDDATGTNGYCPSPPCQAVNLGVITPNPGALTLSGTSFDSENGFTNTDQLSGSYTFSTTFGVIRLPSAEQAPAIYVADPATGTDATEPDAAFLVGSGPTLNAADGDPTASSGVAVGPLPAGPYTLNDGPYVFSTDDGADLLLNYSTGVAIFSTSTESLAVTQDIAGTAGLTINNTTLTLNFNFTPPTGDAAGIVTATNPANGNVLPGTTNSSASSPGDAHVIQGGLIRNVYP